VAFATSTSWRWRLRAKSKFEGPQNERWTGDGNARSGKLHLSGGINHGKTDGAGVAAQQKLVIRRASRNDLASILHIEKASFGRYGWEREDFLGYLAQPRNCVFLLAIRDRTVAGYALAFHIASRAEIDSIAVAPPHRGRGVATSLLRRLIGFLRRRGIPSISLMVRVDNAAAIAAYRKSGFKRERRINRYYEDGSPAWRMRMSL
jgi:ribosomal-protein-alanine N-acetyltransferase